MGLFTKDNAKRALVDILALMSLVGILSTGYGGYILYVDHLRTVSMWQFINLNIAQQQKTAQPQAAPPAKTE